MASPRASVIIPAFNLARYLHAAIESALAQEDPGGPIEVIVVDDGSTDETPQVLEAYSNRVKAVRQPNRGLVGAVDRGLREVRASMSRSSTPTTSGRGTAWSTRRDPRPRPAAGLAHGDMEMIDATGQTTHPSFFEQSERADRRARTRPTASEQLHLGRRVNVPRLAVTGRPADSAGGGLPRLVDRGVHRGGGRDRARHRGQQPLPLPRREHGPRRRRGVSAHDPPPRVDWRRWMMRNLIDDDTVTIDDVRNAFRAWNFALLTAASGGPARARELLDVDPAAAAEPFGSPDESCRRARRFYAPSRGIRSTHRWPSIWRLLCSARAASPARRQLHRRRR